MAFLDRLRLQQVDNRRFRCISYCGLSRHS